MKLWNSPPHLSTDFFSFWFVRSLFQLHLAALASLKNEIVELSGKLRHVTEERDSLKNNSSFTSDRKELIRDYEERLLAQSQQSEEQITELQSVIAELNKKLSSATANKIDELDEVESQTSEHGK